MNESAYTHSPQRTHPLPACMPNISNYVIPNICSNSPSESLNQLQVVVMLGTITGGREPLQQVSTFHLFFLYLIFSMTAYSALCRLAVLQIIVPNVTLSLPVPHSTWRYALLSAVSLPSLATHEYHPESSHWTSGRDRVPLAGSKWNLKWKQRILIVQLDIAVT